MQYSNNNKIHTQHKSGCRFEKQPKNVQISNRKSRKCLSAPFSLIHSTQDQWAREQVKLRRHLDALWEHLGLILAQLDGLHAGAAQWAKSRHREVRLCAGELMKGLSTMLFHSTLSHLPPAQPLPVFAVQFLNGVGDLLDLVPALKPRANSSTGADTFRMPGMGHCTALIKVRPRSFESNCEGALEEPQNRPNCFYCEPLCVGFSS